MICDECETVAHCTKHGCIPKHQALDKMAENARELGLDYEQYKDAIEVSVIFHKGQRMFAVPKQPAQQKPVCIGWDDKSDTPIMGYTAPPAQPAQQQEPVAWKHDCAALLVNDVVFWVDQCPHCGKPRPSPQPAPANLWLYWKVDDKSAVTGPFKTHSEDEAYGLDCIDQTPLTVAAPQPAQRTWQGLTNEEKRQIFEREDYDGWLDYINAIETKLKEKNNG